MDKKLSIFEFAMRCLIVTICIFILLGIFIPNYVFVNNPDRTLRGNVFTGEVKYSNGLSWN
jgi:hypothetical protein